LTASGQLATLGGNKSDNRLFGGNMNIFEFAMKMEEDGRNFYLEQAESAAEPRLKQILMELANDELKHYEIFKNMRDDNSPEYKASEQTTILSSLKNVFETLKESGKEFSFPAGSRDVWVTARDIEKKAEQFYRDKANEETDEARRRLWIQIADEEHKHYVTMQHVIEFLDRPSQWLDDAEWGELD
jgi:rubrerythrin